MTFDAQTIAVIGVLLFSSLVRSTFGFGDALVAMPVLAVLLGLRTATPLVALVGTTLAGVMLVRNLRDVDLSSTWRLVLGGLAGIPVGLFLLKGVVEEPLKIVLALVILGFALYNLTRPRLITLRTERAAPAFGFLSGLLGGAYNTSGPPVLIYGTLRRWNPESYRSTLQGVLFGTSLLVLTGHAVTGLWTTEVLRLYLLALPGAALSLGTGVLLHRAIPEGKFDVCVYLILVLAGGFLLLKTLFGMF
jgi:uncharacterized membrane protein YfcA